MPATSAAACGRSRGSDPRSGRPARPDRRRAAGAALTGPLGVPLSCRSSPRRWPRRARRGLCRAAPSRAATRRVAPWRPIPRRAARAQVRGPASRDLGVVVAGHATTFLIAARVAGATASLRACCRWPLLALLAMAMPLTSAAGGRARAWPPGSSPRPGWAPPGVATARLRRHRPVASLPARRAGRVLRSPASHAG